VFFINNIYFFTFVLLSKSKADLHYSLPVATVNCSSLSTFVCL